MSVLLLTGGFFFNTLQMKPIFCVQYGLSKSLFWFILRLTDLLSPSDVFLFIHSLMLIFLFVPMGL